MSLRIAGGEAGFSPAIKKRNKLGEISFHMNGQCVV
jgi:hypothetical protein